MNWETKLAALNALAECSLKMRNPGDWYVLQSVDIRNKSILRSVCGSGSEPEIAVLDHWNQITEELKSDEYIIARTYYGAELVKRLAVRWNGFMWDRVDEKADVAA